ncbi:hypothetical protein RN001_001523 [Aquatica leii]|uniref:Uncharacterized protein n=1 Tax=Aquatica leii TaxID=1421715 RepID=A0AAN7PG39_9COLE|nr:hypothetical protein RN001_001523 [Aquatica leii]
MEELPVLSGDLFEATNYEDDLNLDSADAQRISNTCEINWIAYLDSIKNKNNILDLNKSDFEISDQEKDNTPNARGVYTSELETCKFGPPSLSELNSSDVEDEVVETISISSEEIEDEWPEFPEGFMEVMDAIEEMINDDYYLKYDIIKARSKLKLSAYEFDVVSDSNCYKRKEKSNKKHISSSSEEDEVHIVSKKNHFTAPLSEKPMNVEVEDISFTTNNTLSDTRIINFFKTISKHLAKQHATLEELSGKQSMILQHLNLRESDALSFNWTGKFQKKPLKFLRLVHIIQGMQRIGMTEESTDILTSSRKREMRKETAITAKQICETLSNTESITKTSISTDACVVKRALTKDRISKNNSHFTISMDANKRKNATIAEKNMEEHAATKIQASFRGYQVRKQLKLKNGGVDVNQRRNIRRKSSGKLRGSEKTKASQPAKNKCTDLEEKSATKIQAGIRGFLVRRRQKKAKVSVTDESTQT